MARDMVMEHLHPTFRQKVELLLQELARANLPFRLFEGFRSPQRQRELYNQGRTRPGAKVTNADAWSSLHQYGVAADFVLYIDGKWSWDDSGERKGWWKQLHNLAQLQGLEPLSWELPHLQMQGMQLAQLIVGEAGLRRHALGWIACLHILREGIKPQRDGAFAQVRTR